MSGRGRARGRGGVQTRAGAAQDGNGTEDEMRQILTELLAPVFVRLDAMEARMGATPPPPTPPPEAGTPQLVMIAPPPESAIRAEGPDV